MMLEGHLRAAGPVPHPIQEVVRVDQNGMEGRPAAVPEGLTGKCASSTTSLLQLFTHSRDTNNYG